MEGIRLAAPADRAALKRIWRACFHDPDAYINLFFDGLYSDGSALLAEAAGIPVAMAMNLPLMTLCAPQRLKQDCGYLYAVATLPLYRGRGLGAALSRAAGASLVLPAEESLYGYYEKLGFSDYFYVDECFAGPGEYAAPGAPAPVPCCPQAYGALREQMLSGRTHLLFSEQALAYQAALGGLYTLCGGCTAVEVGEDGVLYVKELLVPNTAQSLALSSLSAAFPGFPMCIRRPAIGGKNSRRFGQISTKMLPQFSPQKEDIPYFGLAFD